MTSSWLFESHKLVYEFNLLQILLTHFAVSYIVCITVCPIKTFGLRISFTRPDWLTYTFVFGVSPLAAYPSRPNRLCIIRMDVFCIHPASKVQHKVFQVYRLINLADSAGWKLILKLRSSKSSSQSTAAGHVGENSSAHVARSVAVIWPLILFKWSQLKNQDFSASLAVDKNSGFLGIF